MQPAHEGSASRPLGPGELWAEGASECGARIRAEEQCSGGGEALPAPLPEPLRAPFGLPRAAPGFCRKDHDQGGAASALSPLLCSEQTQVCRGRAAATSALPLPPCSSHVCACTDLRLSVGFVKGGHLFTWAPHSSPGLWAPEK